MQPRSINTDFTFLGVSRIRDLPDAVEDSEPATLSQLKALEENSSRRYHFDQVTPQATWTINHNLGYKPSIDLFNSGSQEIDGTVTHTSENQTIVSFTTPVAGFANLN